MKRFFYVVVTSIVVFLITINLHFSTNQNISDVSIEDLVNVALAQTEGGGDGECSLICPDQSEISVPCDCECLILPGEVRCMAAQECGYYARFTLDSATCPL